MERIKNFWKHDYESVTEEWKHIFNGKGAEWLPTLMYVLLLPVGLVLIVPVKIWRMIQLKRLNKILKQQIEEL
jgi:hypothetical protein